MTRTGIRIGLALLLAATLAIGIYGIQRSIWLDEAWVANSVLQPTAAGMFYYPAWLQTTPPLFLLLVRGVVHLLGASSATFRLVSLAFSLLAVVALFAAARRVVSPAFALLGAALMAFQPTAIEYSHTLKQYSAEMAMAAVILWAAIRYLQEPSNKALLWLMAAFAVALPLAFASAFLLPGVVIAVCARGIVRRAAFLVLVCAAVLLPLYLFFIRPNVSPLLRNFWVEHTETLTWRFVAGLAVCVAALAILRIPVMLVAVLPCLLFAAVEALKWYPNTSRTHLFVLPCFFLAAVMVAQKFANWPRIAVAIAFIYVCVGAWNQIHRHRNQPEEDYASAVDYLRRSVQPADVLMVHASVQEGFELYTRMDRWVPSRLIYGDTGYPCCRRVPPAGRSARDDLRRKFPAGFHGRVWLFYSTRRLQWNYVGVDEGQIWKAWVAAQGCSPGREVDFPNLAVSPMDCAEIR